MLRCLALAFLLALAACELLLPFGESPPPVDSGWPQETRVEGQAPIDLDAKATGESPGDRRTPELGIPDLGQVIDITSQVAIKRSGYSFSNGTGRFVQTVTVSGATSVFAGPVSLVLDSLTPTVSLFNKTGTTVSHPPAGSPYLDLDVGPEGQLSPGEVFMATLEFEDPAKIGITYETRVLAGPGPR